MLDEGLNFTKDQLSLIIQKIAESINKHPDQFAFDINVSVIGTQAIANGNSAGLVATAIGGASGSQTIGYVSKVEMSHNKIEIARKDAGDEFLQQMRELSEKLFELADLVKNGSANKSKIEGILNTIKQWKWVPELILTLVNLVHVLG